MSCTTCETGCCSTNVPVRDSTHAKCHCGDTHWCESPVINKGVSNCDDGCCKTSTVSIRNYEVVDQYITGLAAEHMGYSEHNISNTLADISKPVGNCCTPVPQEESCGCNTTPSCGVPNMHYEDINCGTSGTTCCNDGRSYAYGLANRVRGSLNHRCHTYGDIREFVKEIPEANVFLVNHEFIDLLIDEILGVLPTCNISQSVVRRVRKYVELYYVYYKDLDLVGSLVVNDIIPITENLIADETEANRIKAILTALADRLEGRVYEYEQ